VVVERFESLAPERWEGMSLSVHDEGRGWRQTWVDSTGNYWAFEGGPHPEGFAFSTTEIDDGQEIEKRMVFSDIGSDSFDWRGNSRSTAARPGSRSGPSITTVERRPRGSHGKEPVGTAGNRHRSARTR
jgi:hypothetical protein